MNFPDPAKLAARIVAVDRGYADAHVSRGTAPEQICNFLEVCGLPRDPSISFCAAGGSYGILHAIADLTGTPYGSRNAVSVFRSLIPLAEANWCKISASCEQVREWAIAHGKWVSIDAMPDDLTFKPGWIALLNFETDGPEAHHYATIVGDDGNGSDEVDTVEFNTSDISQGHGGAVAAKRRLLDMPQFRGIIKTW